MASLKSAGEAPPELESTIVREGNHIVVGRSKGTLRDDFVSSTDANRELMQSKKAVQP